MPKPYKKPNGRYSYTAPASQTSETRLTNSLPPLSKLDSLLDDDDAWEDEPPTAPQINIQIPRDTPTPTATPSLKTIITTLVLGVLAALQLAKEFGLIE